MTQISVVDYRPDPQLDAELAGLGYAAIHGWPDQRPITAAVVRSGLRPAGMTASTLALHRDRDGALLAAAVVCWPATLEATGRLWGPLVHPAVRGRGVGSALLTTVAGILAARPGVRVTTAEIPESRTEGWSLFERAGWRVSGTSSLLKRPLPTSEEIPTLVPVRAVRAGEYLDQALAALFGGARPDVGFATARDTYSRWTSDSRYVPDGLLFAEGPQGLLGATLVYPLSDPGTGEPSEALLADLVTCRHLDPTTAEAVRSALVGAALNAAAAAGAAVARAVFDDADVLATLLVAGFKVADRVRYYAPPESGDASISTPGYAGWRLGADLPTISAHG